MRSTSPPLAIGVLRVLKPGAPILAFGGTRDCAANAVAGAPEWNVIVEGEDAEELEERERYEREFAHEERIKASYGKRVHVATVSPSGTPRLGESGILLGHDRCHTYRVRIGGLELLVEATNILLPEDSATPPVSSLRTAELLEELRVRLAKLEADGAALREAADEHRNRATTLDSTLRMVLASAYPNPVEHPTMARAWAEAQAVLGLAEMKTGPDVPIAIPVGSPGKHRVFLYDTLAGTAVGFEARRWNGWLCPLFDRKGAEALANDWRLAKDLDAHYDPATDAWVFANEDGEPDVFQSRMWNGIKVWPIGAGCYWWLAR